MKILELLLYILLLIIISNCDSTEPVDENRNEFILIKTISFSDDFIIDKEKSRIFYTQKIGFEKGQLLLMNTDGQNEEVLFAIENKHIEGAISSNDKSNIAFIGYDFNGFHILYNINVFTRETLVMDENVDVPHQKFFYPGVYSLDNRYFFYRTTHLGSDSSYIYKYNLSTSTKELLYSSNGRVHPAAFLPNGQLIIKLSDAFGSSIDKLFSIDLNSNIMNSSITSYEDLNYVNLLNQDMLAFRESSWKSSIQNIVVMNLNTYDKNILRTDTHLTFISDYNDNTSNLLYGQAEYLDSTYVFRAFQNNIYINIETSIYEVESEKLEKELPSRGMLPVGYLRDDRILVVKHLGSQTELYTYTF